MRKDNSFRIFILLLVVGMCVWSVVPSILVFSKKNDTNQPLEKRDREVWKRAHPNWASKSLNLGLDLAGGTHIIVEVQKDQLPKEQQATVLDQALEIVRNRVDQYGLSEPVITKSGESRIVADLAGMGADEARGLIGATALLEFKLVAEGPDLKPILDHVDAYLNKVKGMKGGLPVAKSDTNPVVRSLFGTVVKDTAAAGTKDSAKLVAGGTPAEVDSAKRAAAAQGAGKDSGQAKRDSAKLAADSALKDTGVAEEFLRTRPFSSMLVSLGRDIGVRYEDYPKVKAILDNPDVQMVIPNRYQFLWGREVENLQNGQKVKRLYLLKRRAEMTGKYIADAKYQRASGGFNNGEMEVELSFKGIGPKEFGRITGANTGRQLAIVLDSVVYSAPVIQGRIPNGRASITGNFDIKEAKQLAVTLRAGSLPAPMRIVELRSVGPTLGEQNIHRGILAACLSLLLVAIFMVAYYHRAGLIADLALVLNMLIIFAVLSMFHATLTLPGIAGIALTIGMAVDANVLIFERIREELRAGRSVRAAVDAGYKKAFSAIFDSNVTTLGTAAILYYIGVGPIKGFGLTLMVGLAASMYTAIGVTHLVFDLILARKDVKELSIGKGIAWFHKVDLKVIPYSRYYVGVSLAVLLVGLGAIAVRGLNWGIDFTGGHVYTLQLDRAPDAEAIRRGVASMGIVDPKVQTIGGTNANQVLVSTPNKNANDSLARQEIARAVPGAKVIGEESVGPSVGKDLRRSALLSILLSLVLIVIYIWFRFGRNGLGFGLGGVLGIIHDSLITVGIFALFSREISLDFVAAILTILGYSLNDSIIIFDRIRELTGLASSKDSFAVRVNNANNQCLSRSVITHVTVFFTVLILSLLGGSSIQDFSIAMTIGVVVGTYSTIAVACPFVVWWDRRRVAPAPAVAKR